MRQHSRGKSYGNEQSLGNFCEDALKNSDSVLCSNSRICYRTSVRLCALIENFSQLKIERIKNSLLLAQKPSYETD